MMLQPEAGTSINLAVNDIVGWLIARLKRRAAFKHETEITLITVEVT